MKKLLRTIGRQVGPDRAFILNNGVREEFCGSPGRKVKGRELIGLDRPYHDKPILGSLRNESSPILDRTMETVFTEGGRKEGSSGDTVFPVSPSLNQSSLDDIFTLPTHNSAIARDLPSGFPNDKPEPTFFTTAPVVTIGSAQDTPTIPIATPIPTTTSNGGFLPLSVPASEVHSATPSNGGFLPLSGLASDVHSAAPSPTSAGVTGVQILDFVGLDVSLAFSRKLAWCYDSMDANIRDPSSSLVHLESRNASWETVSLARMEGSKSCFSFEVGRRAGVGIARSLIEPME